MTDTIDAVMADEVVNQQELAEQLLAQAKTQGVDLVGPGGLLNQITKRVLEAALEAEMSEHLGYDKHEYVGRDGGNSRNGVRSKTVLTEIGPVQIDVPRDTDASFDPQIVRKRQRRLTGVDQIVLSLTARGLTTGEISAHFAEVYGASVSRDTISKITDRVVEEMTEWFNRPLDKVYPVIFIDAIVVKVRYGQVRNKPMYVVIGVTVNGERDILGIWAGDGGEGAKSLSLRPRHGYAVDLHHGLPGRGFHRPGKFPTHRTRRDAPLPAHIHQIRAGIALRDFKTLVPRVLLSITLTGPTPSGSAAAPRLCQGWSHPPRHLPDQAALSSTGPLRRTDHGGLSPPLEQQRLTAHEASAQRIRDHLRRTHYPEQ